MNPLTIARWTLDRLLDIAFGKPEPFDYRGSTTRPPSNCSEVW